MSSMQLDFKGRGSISVQPETFGNIMKNKYEISSFIIEFVCHYQLHANSILHDDHI